MPKQSSTGSTPVKRLPGRKRSASNTARARSDRPSLKETAAQKHARQARKLVMEAWPVIIQGLIKKAADGGTQQTKLLLELCDLASTEAPNLSEEHKQQLCDALLAGWKLTSAEPEDSPVVENPASETK